MGILYHIAKINNFNNENTGKDDSIHDLDESSIPKEDILRMFRRNKISHLHRTLAKDQGYVVDYYHGTFNLDDVKRHFHHRKREIKKILYEIIGRQLYNYYIDRVRVGKSIIPYFKEKDFTMLMRAYNKARIDLYLSKVLKKNNTSQRELAFESILQNKMMREMSDWNRSMMRDHFVNDMVDRTFNDIPDQAWAGVAAAVGGTAAGIGVTWYLYDQDKKAQEAEREERERILENQEEALEERERILGRVLIWFF